jgi:hypothetical protein
VAWSPAALFFRDNGWVEMDADREERERIVIEIRKLRAKLRDAADPSAARVVDGLLRNAEARLAGLLEQVAV